MKRLYRHLIVLFASVAFVLLFGFWASTWGQTSTGAGTITVSQQQLIFSNVASGGAQNQTIQITSSGSGVVTLNTANTAPWLNLNPAGPYNLTAGSPTSVIVTANAAGSPALGPGTYETSFQIVPQGSGASPTTVLATMTVEA